MGIIYKATNKINKKVYIGQTMYSLEERINNQFMGHKKRALDEKYNNYFYNSIRKHGWDNFEWTILETVDNSELDEREKYWIKYYNSNNHSSGYNQTEGGHKHYHRSEACKKLMSEQTKKRFEDENFRKNFCEKVRIAMKRPEVKAKCLTENGKRKRELKIYKKAICEALHISKVVINKRHPYYYLYIILKNYFMQKFGKNFMYKAYWEKVRLGLVPKPKSSLIEYNKTDLSRKASSMRMRAYNQSFWSDPDKVQERKEKVSAQMKKRWKSYHENKEKSS